MIAWSNKNVLAWFIIAIIFSIISGLLIGFFAGREANNRYEIKIETSSFGRGQTSKTVILDKRTGKATYKSEW